MLLASSTSVRVLTRTVFAVILTLVALASVSANAHAATTVNGTVTDAAAQPLAGASVSLYVVETFEDGGETFIDYYEDILDTTTNALGEYSFELPDDVSNYTVRASAAGHSSRFLGNEWSIYGDGTQLFTATDPIDHTLPTIALPVSTNVSGTVLDSGSAPIEGAEVELYSVTEGGVGDQAQSLAVDDYSYIETATTDALGSFTFELPDDSLTYVVRADADGFNARWLGNTTSIYDELTDTFTAADALLGPIGPITLPAATVVSGSILDSDNSPIENADVDLYRVWTFDDGGTTEIDDWDYVGGTSSDSSGNYSLTLPDDSYTYAVRASADGYGARWLGGTSSITDSGTRLFTASDPSSHDLGALALPLANGISGTVTDDGNPAADIQMTLYRWTGTEWGYVTDGATEIDGSYGFLSLDDGTYTLEFGEYGFFGGGTVLPATPDASNSLTVAGGETKTADFALPPRFSASGTITDSEGAVSGARVQAYAWNGADWSYTSHEVTSGADGSFTLPELAAGTYALRVLKAHHNVGFLGGLASFPATPGVGNSFVVSNADVTGQNVTLTPRASTLGKVAGQNFAFCRANDLAPNDDGSTGAITVPFNLKYFGNPYTTLFVNNNGNITFNGPQSTYTPSALNGGTSAPIIAPFFADVDTRDTDESDVVTYGASPDGSQFCVNWADVEPYSGTSQTGKLNTFQLIITKREGVPGRSDGDFDITYNYDQIQWDTGSASGGTSAVAGYASGTGVDGTYFQLAGSLVPGAFLDGGVNSLVAGQQNSGHAGRYVFEVHNAGTQTTLGSLAGVVKLPNGDPAPSTYIEVSNGDRAYYTTTNSLGQYNVSGLSAGEYTIRAWPNDSQLRQAGAGATVVAGELATAPDIQFEAPQVMPPSVGLSSPTFGSASSGSVPTVYYNDPVALSYTGGSGCTVSYSMTSLIGAVLEAGPMTEGPAGTYSATIPPVYPNHGDATITITSSCSAPVAFSIYIDPSGTVVDSWGMPVSGATATLLRSETVDGTYGAVPNGSEIMSATNRQNPMTTDSTGFFGWDVTAAWYKVAIDKTGYSSFTTPALQVPPARLDLVVKLSGGSAPSLTSTVTGSAEVGNALTAVKPAGLSGEFSVVSYKWLRDGAVIAGASSKTYKLTDADGGKQIKSVVTVKHDSVRFDPLDSSNMVTFTPFDASSAAVSVPPVILTRTTPQPEAPLAAAISSAPKKSKAGAKIRLKLLCPAGCKLGLSLKIGKKKISGLKAIAIKAGTTSYKLKLPARVTKKIKAALKKSKKTKIVLSLTISGTDGSGQAKPLKVVLTK